MFGLSRLSQGGFRRFFWGFPVASLGLLFARTWPDRPTGLPSAPLQAHEILRWSALGAVFDEAGLGGYWCKIEWAAPITTLRHRGP